jgi:hypothetical protein
VGDGRPEYWAVTDGDLDGATLLPFLIYVTHGANGVNGVLRVKNK